MQGVYRIYDGGTLIAESANVITDMAPIAILRFMAGFDRSWASSIGVGCSTEEPTKEDTRLGFEIGRGSIKIKSPDIENKSVVAKGTIPRDVVGVINELGVFSATSNPNPEMGQSLISDFNPVIIDIDGVEAVAGRIGNLSAKVVVAENETVDVRGMSLDISALSGRDELIFAYDADNIYSVTLKFMNSESAYLEHTFNPDQGFGVESWRINEFLSEGGGTHLDPFYRVELDIQSSTGGGEFTLEGLAKHDTDLTTEQMLISRTVLETPIEKTNASELEVEYSLAFNF